MNTIMTKEQEKRYLEVIDKRLKSLSQSIIELPLQAKGFKKMYKSLVAEKKRVLI